MVVKTLKLKVGIMNDCFPPTLDGTATTTLNYANIINEKFGESMVITPRVPGVKDVGYPYEVYRYKSFPLSYKDEYRFGWPFKQEFREHVREKKLDILHYHCPFASAHFAKLITEEHPIPIVMTYHTKYDYDIKKRVPAGPIRDFAFRFLLNHVKIADEVWVVSEGAGRNLRSMGYDGDYIVMPNGVDFPRGKVDTAEVSRRHNLSEDIPTFLFVGRMMWYKNLKFMIDALKVYRDRGNDFRMIMIGKGTDRAAIERHIAKCGLTDKFIFTGKISGRDELRAYYSRADAFLFASTFDSHGLVVREAAACECPSLLIDGSDAADGVEHGVTGYLAKETPDDFASVLEEMAADKEKLREVGKNASEKIYLSWEDSIRMAYERYENLCKSWVYDDGRTFEDFPEK